MGYQLGSEIDLGQHVPAGIRPGCEALGRVNEYSLDAKLFGVRYERRGRLRLGRGGEGERADEREQRRGGERAGGAEEPAPRAAQARETHRAAGGGIGL